MTEIIKVTGFRPGDRNTDPLTLLQMENDALRAQVKDLGRKAKEMENNAGGLLMDNTRLAHALNMNRRILAAMLKKSGGSFGLSQGDIRSVKDTDGIQQRPWAGNGGYTFALVPKKELDKAEIEEAEAEFAPTERPARWWVRVWRQVRGRE